MRFYILVITMFLIVTPVMGQEIITVKNHSFEQNSRDEILNWKVSGQYETDKNISHSGSSSIKFNHDKFSKSEAISEPLELKLGELYELSGWVKTKNAVTNPMDRYPTSVAACLTMESFPFTNHSETAGGTKDWKRISIKFIASKKTDRIKLNFGYNGDAKGNVWFDDIQLKKLEDITEYIPYESVKWFDKGFRYDDKGWIFVHIEGTPYQRGYQYGYLTGEDMAEYINKLSIQQNKDNPEKGWNDLRFVANGFMLNKYELEYVTEMKGIADGANKAGIKLFKRKFDLIDVVAMNSAIDIDYAKDAVSTTPNALSGHSFLKSEDELDIPNRLHKCSSFLANGSSTTDGRILFGQIFMWGGYTGAHWNVITDVVPTEGNRLVYQTFPGGIHSGADFYMNSSGIMIGETTVGQTPLNPEGSPQSNRIRKAAQYANNIDDVVKILTTNNNGMYTNDWLIGDTKNDEIAVLLLGTYKHKLWRSSKNDFYGDTKDFYWCNNNNKDNEVRKEYISNADNAPYDLTFNPWNRDIAFNEFYQEYKGKMDAISGVNLWASSPINRPHACDGKVTTSEMAEKMVFLAHYGKVTLREKFVGENGRIPDLPGAAPHLTLGYSIVSPVFTADKLIEEKKKRELAAAMPENKDLVIVSDEINNLYSFDDRKLWINTVYASTNAENWFVSGTAAYWQILKNINKSDLLNYTRDQFAELNCRYLYTIEREGSIEPVNAKRIYTKYNNYQIPRIKGTYLLHQLRLYLGNETFSEVMNKVHETYREKEITNNNFISLANQVSGKNLNNFINQWIGRSDLPEIKMDYAANGNEVTLTINQNDQPYHLFTSIEIETAENKIYKLIEVKERQQSISFTLNDKPVSARLNALNDFPQNKNEYYTWANIFDEWKSAKIIYGTSRQIEANHTLALRFSTALADRFTEDLIPVTKDSELSEEDIKNSDLIVLGSPDDNSFMKLLCEKLGIVTSTNTFTYNNKVYSRGDEGLYLSVSNPFSPLKALYLFISNSAPEFHQMTKVVNRMPQWAIFRGDKIIEKGYFR